MKKNTSIVIASTLTGLTLLWFWYLHNRSKNKLVLSPRKAPVVDPQKSYKAEDHFIHTPVVSPVVSRKKSKNNAAVNLLSSKEDTQLILGNTSEKTREIHLWSGHKKPPISPLLPGDVPKHKKNTLSINNTSQQGIYPQGMVFNPANGYTYIAYQLSGTIDIIHSKGVIQTLSLARHTPIVNNPSPVDLTVHSIADSNNYGKVYSANILNNTVSVITSDMEITNTIVVGTRPIGICFNPVNQMLYVANLSDDTVSIIDTQTESVLITVGVGKSPRSITIDPITGYAYVLTYGDNSISVLNTDFQVIEIIADIAESLTTAAYYPANNHLYVVASQQNQVIPIDLETYTVAPAIVVGNNPYKIIYHPKTELLYVGNREDATFSLIDITQTVVATLSLGKVNTGIAIDTTTDRLYSSDPVSASIAVISYSNHPQAIHINQQYYEKREDFIYNPVLVEHVKIIFSGASPISVLELEKQTISGKSKSYPISLSKYTHPRNVAKVYEVTGLKDSLLDGSHGWKFKIQPGQTISMIIYYHQIKREQLNPNYKTPML
ncbi:YncE family protein [Aquimarina sp. TRL1]|uniref:YncE family protein n=1 Tax=Aquimarina sp. (strain TRL1) TaxID=2736252 RepID=UPI001589646A|nr:YncE family protein [Aquimarina sp. TRL1]QKX05368.1 YncE family protein [Aquimarina sp. TRL1]